MALDALLFDIDGTLLDTNSAHVEAWRRAFEEFGYRIARDRIELEIGKGGDKLVPSILGDEVDKRDGDAMRKRQPEEFARLAKYRSFAPFPSAMRLLDEARSRNLKIALATSSKRAHLQVLTEASGVDLEGAVDLITTADDAEESKPAPDIVSAAVQKLGLSPAQCAMVGDTLYDMQSAKHAGVIGIGLLTGYQSQETLLRSGARAVFKDPAQLLHELTQALELVSPTTAHLTQELLESLMADALQLAREAALTGEAPVGCIIADGEARIIARGFEQTRQGADPTAHAEMLALAAAAGSLSSGRRDRILVCTREPCVMCTGAAMQAAIDTIVYGMPVPADSGTGRVVPPETADSQMPRIVGGVLEKDCSRLFREMTQGKS